MQNEKKIVHQLFWVYLNEFTAKQGEKKSASETSKTVHNE